MIGRIRGTLIEKTPPEIVIEASGVGYEIQLPMTSFYNLPTVGEEATIFTHFIVREDAQLLFGFADKGARALFRELIKVNGVGPKLALTILSGMSAEQFVQCVSHDDVSGLVKLPGVGKKTAERLVVEMRDRLKKFTISGTESDLPIMQEQEQGSTFVMADDAREEALSALVALGYKPQQASKMVQSVFKDDMSSEALIRESLRSVA
ncbi:Holliday junction branch migration protein RuvA [Aestuariibacter sp. AA17]|uniref:Holliday junction branch migration complex subunit RuvA n=1 Tax=Fluctibacter corallii TaxID=2984329 RepID=A0ABT3AA48_9ALTE|nr:Holliday junction branch migration protein RuvA [Aestuariibacter sp. AA17]MCV2885550.1 Holliday junction branch migration protein RuvA [Aestuariibacter sp. AA17]